LGSTKRSFLILDQLRVVAVLLLVFVVMVLPDIGQVFEKQHGQDIVLVDAGIDGAAEGVAGVPDGLIDFALVHVRHDGYDSNSC